MKQTPLDLLHYCSPEMSVIVIDKNAYDICATSTGTDSLESYDNITIEFDD